MTSKPCPPGKILNPETKRCVKRDGRIGRRLLKTTQTSNNQQDILNQIDTGTIVRQKLPASNAVALMIAQKTKNFIRIITHTSRQRNVVLREIPSVFRPFWGFGHPRHVFQYTFLFKRDETQCLVSLGPNNALFMERDAGVLKRVCIDLNNKSPPKLEAFVPWAETLAVSPWKWDWTALKSIRAFNESFVFDKTPVIQRAAVAFNASDAIKHRYLKTTGNHQDPAPSHDGVKFVKASTSYKVKFGSGRTAHLKFVANALGERVDLFGAVLEVTTPYAHMTNTSYSAEAGIVTLKKPDPRDHISEDWAAACEIFNDFFVGMDFKTKKDLVIKKLYKGIKLADTSDAEISRLIGTLKFDKTGLFITEGNEKNAYGRA